MNKIMVETYLMTEHKNLLSSVEDLEQWKKTAAELGLDGQLELAKEDKSPIPFEFMNKSMERVYNTLCPTKSPVKEFNTTPIPLEILSLIALSEKEKYFDEIEIWSDNEEPDPVAVGVVKKSEYNKVYYLIGRWGDELCSFTELFQRAQKRLGIKKKAEFESQISELKMKLESLQARTINYLNGNSWDV